MLPAHRTLLGPGQSTNHHHQAALPMDVHVGRQSFHLNGLNELLSSSDPEIPTVTYYSGIIFSHTIWKVRKYIVYIYIYICMCSAVYTAFIGILSGIYSVMTDYLAFILASIWQSFWHSIWHLIIFFIHSGILFWHFLSYFTFVQIFYPDFCLAFYRAIFLKFSL